ncbi:hypothetical protein ES332_A11G127100v1 [Gossypium tomentosum]|uniref:Uncharacterized protein n=1 Tax=Gossypium tomentosum TaxID=34277 RepID=A0A5D2NAX0_GOSTO|nr:hypothetical protein ES332_A11G127100v1 [Gossypium tomentosum]
MDDVVAAGCYCKKMMKSIRPPSHKCVTKWRVPKTQAERTQKEGGMMMCATVLVILCFIMIVLLILKELLL